MIDSSNYNVYTNKDGRTRVYDKTTHKVTSYPRLIMESILGRKLLPNEDVHHIDENPLNNDPNNLEVIDHSIHERNHATKLVFQDKEMICPTCNNSFIWTAEKQRKARKNSYGKYKKAGPFCSKKCVGLYGQRLQMKYREETKTNE